MGKKRSLNSKQSAAGWSFLLPAVILIAVMSFYPMFRALLLSFQTGKGTNFRWAGLFNYARMFKDKVFIQSLINCFFYLLIQVPIMLILALVLASILNKKDLKFKGLFRTAIFLPCATALVSYATIFRSLFATDGFINNILLKAHLIKAPFEFLMNPTAARFVIIIALIWRWTGYNMVFYLAALQNIDFSIYEAAKLDGANAWQAFWRMTVPLLKPTMLLTLIMSTNGTLQLFDESMNLTSGGPANMTMTMSHYIYNTSFKFVPNFGYSAAMSFVILILVFTLAAIQMKVGDQRD